MADRSAIEWTNSTWNPVTGCTKISAGCDNCYAERFAERFRGVPGHPYEMGFDLTLRPERLDQPLRWRQPRMIFVNSMSDLFHKHVPWDFVDDVFESMERADWHVFQILTKRSSRMRDYVNRRYANSDAPPNLWFGVSVEDGRGGGSSACGYGVEDGYLPLELDDGSVLLVAASWEGVSVVVDPGVPATRKGRPPKEPPRVFWQRPGHRAAIC